MERKVKMNNFDVPVHKSYHKQQHQQHKSDDLNAQQIHKTFAANFKPELESVPEKLKPSRKHILKENEKLSLQFNTVQNNLTKRETQIQKLKEKLISVRNFNTELLNENNLVKTEYRNVLVQLDGLKTEIETRNRKCLKCEELKIVMKTVNGEFETVERSNQELNEDLNMLKNVVYRLNVQLERYQTKLQKTDSTALIETTEINNISLEPAAIEQHQDHYHLPISWGRVNTHTLSPLLNAYQDYINEKEDIIKNYEDELNQFTFKLKHVLNENETLHRKNLNDMEMVQKCRNELDLNRNELAVVKEQNDLLIKKCALKHDKLQEICKVYDHKIECVKRDDEVLQEQYHKTRLELNVLQSKHQTLIDTHEALKNDKHNVIPMTVHTTSVNECKRLFEELKLQYDNEKLKLSTQIKQMEQQIKEIEPKLNEYQSEKHQLQNENKNTEKLLKKSEQKLTEVQNALTHAQISRNACKKQLSKAIEFGQELVNEQESLLKQLSSKRKENKMVKEYGSNIVSRMDLLKTQLKSVQKGAIEQLATVEQRIQEQDSSIESMRKDYELEIVQLRHQLDLKEEHISKLEEQQLTSLKSSTPYLLYREKHVRLT